MDVPPTEAAASVDATRRALLRYGALLPAAAVLPGVAVLEGCSSAPPQPAAGFRFLLSDDLLLFRALIPTVLGTALPRDEPLRSQALAHTLQNIDNSLYRLNPPTAGGIRQLLGALNFTPMRWVMTGIRHAWAQAQPAEKTAMLQRWHDSAFGQLNAGYRALTRTIAASYFTTDISRSVSGYPGPPQPAYTVLNLDS